MKLKSFIFLSFLFLAYQQSYGFTYRICNLSERKAELSIVADDGSTITGFVVGGQRSHDFHSRSSGSLDSRISINGKKLQFARTLEVRDSNREGDTLFLRYNSKKARWAAIDRGGLHDCFSKNKKGIRVPLK